MNQFVFRVQYPDRLASGCQILMDFVRQVGRGVGWRDDFYGQIGRAFIVSPRCGGPSRTDESNVGGAYGWRVLSKEKSNFYDDLAQIFLVDEGSQDQGDVRLNATVAGLRRRRRNEFSLVQLMAILIISKLLEFFQA